MPSASLDGVKPRLEQRVLERAAPLLWALAASFSFFAIVTLIVRPPGALGPLATIDIIGALGCAIAAGLSRRARPRYGNAIVGSALLAGVLASIAAIALLGVPAETTNVLILDLTASIFLLDPDWLAAIVATGVVGWAILADAHGFSAEWLNAGFALVASAIAAAAVQFVRLRDARAASVLAMENEDKTLSLARAAAQADRRSIALARANDSLEAFSYVIAHDMKEPMRAVSIYLDELGDHIDDEERHDLLARARRSHQQLEHIVTGLLDWSRVSSAPVEPETVDIRALLEDETTRAIFGRLRDERRAALLIDPDVPLVRGATVLLRQAFGNLILNALRHNQDPTPQVRIYAAPDAPAGMADIIIEDNGPGFPQSVLDRFAALDGRPSTVKGGFGLAIARRAADRLNGRLVLRNAPKGGAQAHLLLPAAEAPTTTPVAPVKPQLERRIA